MGEGKPVGLVSEEDFWGVLVYTRDVAEHVCGAAEDRTATSKAVVSVVTGFVNIDVVDDVTVNKGTDWVVRGTVVEDVVKCVEVKSDS